MTRPGLLQNAKRFTSIQTQSRALQSSAQRLIYRRARPAVTHGNQVQPTAFGKVTKRFASQLPERNSIGAFTPTAAALFVVAGIGLAFYFRNEKTRLEEEREKERSAKSYGRPQVGGPFSLTTHGNKSFTQDDLLGKWSLVYFGFTNCPDICPAEMDKMTEVINSAQKYHGDIFLPVFISVDPARDSTSQISQYLEDFHSQFVGLVGDYATTKAVCKAYRVYFSTPPNADPNGDYLVDHSIFIYLMDPEGKFVDAFGQVVTSADAQAKINGYIEEWRKDHGGSRL
ncbi:SCO1/SenC-domain-containing protein [Crepidotus variabilis]|uniref:SCO1/SenC-domain-containing protein n=1 Tax=Crepidotus variabilis TaxID=179855 RepID=A0A9P6ELF0_9AGAR|nr:SCO1/SenC-domain-containing protein [Crepidotus variabilis]